jgi:hypothetical protein
MTCCRPEPAYAQERMNCARALTTRCGGACGLFERHEVAPPNFVVGNGIEVEDRVEGDFLSVNLLGHRHVEDGDRPPDVDV